MPVTSSLPSHQPLFLLCFVHSPHPHLTHPIPTSLTPSPPHSPHPHLTHLIPTYPIPTPLTPSPPHSPHPHPTHPISTSHPIPTHSPHPHSPMCSLDATKCDTPTQLNRTPTQLNKDTCITMLDSHHCCESPQTRYHIIHTSSATHAHLEFN